MTLVGPRPEQPEIVAPAWSGGCPTTSGGTSSRPGHDGMGAQVRCGYAGTDLGAAWKLCHDLYYLKHRSPLFRPSSSSGRRCAPSWRTAGTPSSRAARAYLVPEGAVAGEPAELGSAAEPSEDALVEGAAS